MDCANFLKMQTESALHLRRQDSYAIALTFAVADGDLVVAEVHVFDPKPDAFHEVEALLRRGVRP